MSQIKISEIIDAMKVSKWTSVLIFQAIVESWTLEEQKKCGQTWNLWPAAASRLKHPVANYINVLQAYVYKSVKTGLFLKPSVATNVTYF